MPFQLIYSSEAAPDLDLADFQKMLVEFRRRNQARGITGVLVLVEGVFVQILEGEKERVLRLLQSLERDPRHRQLKVFHRQETDGRTFSSWNMAYLSPSAEEVSAWAELEGAMTIHEVVASLESDPARLQSFVGHLLRALAE
jgi:Sensors of blue-light using FAD